MPSIPIALYTVQQHELMIDRARARIEEIDHELSNDARVVACQTALTTAEAELHTRQTHAKDIELQIQGLTQKITEVDTLLYSGKISNPKELTERQDELASLQRRHKGLEEQLMDAMANVEAAQQSVATAEADLVTAQATQQAAHVHLHEERARLDAAIKTELKARKNAMQQVPEQEYVLYKNLRKQKNGQAVALLNGDTCGFCQVEQTTSVAQQVRQGQELVYCYSCGRILASITNGDRD